MKKRLWKRDWKTDWEQKVERGSQQPFSARNGQNTWKSLFLGKNRGKWSKMTSNISAGFFFQPFALNLSFNLPFTILLLKSFFHNLYLFHNHYLTIFSSQSLFHNLSFTIIPSQSFFHNLSCTIFCSQFFFHNLYN